jgi:MFS family permease
MNQNISQVQLRSCFKCRFEGNTAQAVCPRCGRRLFTATNIRWRGALMIFIGLFLSGFMSVIAVLATGLLMQAAKNPNTSSKLNEETHMLVFVYLIFGGVIAIGLAATVAGLWMAIFGRRNVVLIWIFFALIILTFFVGGIFQALAP